MSEQKEKHHKLFIVKVAMFAIYRSCGSQTLQFNRVCCVRSSGELEFMKTM